MRGKENFLKEVFLPPHPFSSKTLMKGNGVFVGTGVLDCPQIAIFALRETVVRRLNSVWKGLAPPEKE